MSAYVLCWIIRIWCFSTLRRFALNFAGKSAEVTDGMPGRCLTVWIRHVVVPGLTDDDTLLDELVEFVRHYKVVRKIEWLPYHTMGVFKYKELGLDYPLTDVPPLARERIEAIKKRFEGIFPC